jgi:hypothetical protein
MGTNQNLLRYSSGNLTFEVKEDGILRAYCYKFPSLIAKLIEDVLCLSRVPSHFNSILPLPYHCVAPVLVYPVSPVSSLELKASPSSS